MVPKTAFDALVQQLSILQATIDRLTSLLEEKNQIILNQNRARFGQSSEKRTYLLCDGQLSLFEQARDGVTEKKPEEASSAEKQEVSVSAHTRKPKRTMEELCASIPEETVIVDLPEEQKFTADGRPLKCIGTDDVRVELIREPRRVYKRVYRCKVYAIRKRKRRQDRPTSGVHMYPHHCCPTATPRHLLSRTLS